MSCLPDFMGAEFGHTCGFILHKADVADGVIQPLPIVEHLDDSNTTAWVSSRTKLRG